MATVASGDGPDVPCFRRVARGVGIAWPDRSIVDTFPASGDSQVNAHSSPARVRYVAELSGVREVLLIGTADPAYWRDRVADLGLAPATMDGKARISINAMASRFHGVRFREICVALAVHRLNDNEQQDTREDIYLVGAFNSSRFFTFVERRWFSTPYAHAAIEVDVRPARIHLVAGSGTVVEAAQSSTAGPRTQVDGAPYHWEGTIFLPPGARRRADNLQRSLFARISGHTRTYPFARSTDLLTIRPADGPCVWADLLESGFAPTEWVVRENAAHARSKTFTRPAP